MIDEPNNQYIAYDLFSNFYYIRTEFETFIYVTNIIPRMINDYIGKRYVMGSY